MQFTKIVYNKLHYVAETMTKARKGDGHRFGHQFKQPPENVFSVQVESVSEQVYRGGLIGPADTQTGLSVFSQRNVRLL